MTSQEKAIETSHEKIDSLTIGFRERTRQWFNRMWEIGHPVLVYYGFRSMEEQAQLHEKNPKGAAEPGKSFHQFGAAIDFVPLKQNPMCDMFEADWDNDDEYAIATDIAKDYGLVPISKETGHFQDSRYASWQDAKRAYDGNLWPTA